MSGNSFLNLRPETIELWRQKEGTWVSKPCKLPVVDCFRYMIPLTETQVILAGYKDKHPVSHAAKDEIDTCLIVFDTDKLTFGSLWKVENKELLFAQDDAGSAKLPLGIITAYDGDGSNMLLLDCYRHQVIRYNVILDSNLDNKFTNTLILKNGTVKTFIKEYPGYGPDTVYLTEFYKPLVERVIKEKNTEINALFEILQAPVGVVNIIRGYAADDFLVTMDHKSEANVQNFNSRNEEKEAEIKQEEARHLLLIDKLFHDLVGIFHSNILESKPNNKKAIDAIADLSIELKNGKNHKKVLILLGCLLHQRDLAKNHSRHSLNIWRSKSPIESLLDNVVDEFLSKSNWKRSPWIDIYFINEFQQYQDKHQFAAMLDRRLC